MARPRTPLGAFGDIEFSTVSNGVRARTRVRDYDGVLRRVEVTGPCRKAAEIRLKERLAQRGDFNADAGELTADSTFGRLIEVWLADIELEDRLSQSTRELYARDTKLVLPTFKNLALREITVRRIDQFLKRLAATQSYSKAKHAKVVLNLAFGLAVRYDALRENPVRETARLRPPPSEVLALTGEEVNAIRRAVRSWRRQPGHSGPRPDGQLEQIIEVMLGTSARIGEVLAIRKCDVDVTSSPATVRICGTIVSHKGQPTMRQPSPKTAKSVRTVAVPTFAATELRARLALISVEPPDHLIFFSRNHTPLTTNNVRRRLRAVLEEAGISGVTPHTFRRTVATVVDRESGVELAAEMLGRTSSDITRRHYIQTDDRVNRARPRSWTPWRRQRPKADCEQFEPRIAHPNHAGQSLSRGHLDERPSVRVAAAASPGGSGTVR